MNDRTEVERKTKSTRDLAGRVIFWIGLVLLICGMTLTSIMGLGIYLSNIAGSGLSTTPSTYQIPNTIALVGFVTLMIGITIRYAIFSLSNDDIWSLKTGPIK